MIFEFLKSNWVEIIGAVFGLLYLFFEYKADIRMWPAGIIMSLFFTYVFIEAKFYAFAGINIYYIIAGVYGWIKWKKSISTDENNNIKLKHTPTRLYLPLSIAICFIFGIIAVILINLTDSQVVYGDSIMTTLSIVSMWMLAHKYVEQWLLLIVLNVISTVIYQNQGMYPTSIMYLMYAIVSVLGYIRWRKFAN